MLSFLLGILHIIITNTYPADRFILHVLHGLIKFKDIYQP